jgi:4-hydroxy-tetrahydrodipicolinate synthase
MRGAERPLDPLDTPVTAGTGGWERAVMIAAAPTPFAADGGPALGAFGAHVDHLAKAGVDGVFVAGTTGEGPLLSDDEVVAMVATAASEARARCAVIAHVGRVATRATIALARAAVAAGADAVAAVVPYYYAVTPDQVVAHFAALADAGLGVPVFAYTIPKRAMNDIGPELVPRLADAGLAGLKDSTGSLRRHVEYLEAASDAGGFRLLTGTDGHLHDALRAGSGGGVTAVTASEPALTASLRDAYLAGDEARAAELQTSITRAKAAMDAAAPSPTGIKRVVAAELAAVGIDYPTRMREPLG